MLYCSDGPNPSHRFPWELENEQEPKHDRVWTVPELKITNVDNHIENWI